MNDRGIVSFIKMKLEHSIHPTEIKKMLSRAGFSDETISAGFEQVKQQFNDVHQDIAAANDFLPPLNKKTSTTASPLSSQQEKSRTGSKASERRRISDIKLPSHKVISKSMSARDVGEIHNPAEYSRAHKGLFRGRLRRKDFILGFLFFFSIGYVTLALSATFISLLAPSIWESILLAIQQDKNGILLAAVPFILAPITVMMLSLIYRRLHNLGLPGGLSLLFLVMFITPTNDLFMLGYWALYIALIILFIILLLVKGDPGPNQYGTFPESRGSFFRKIFNI